MIPKCEKCGMEKPNTKRKFFPVLRISGIYCETCCNILNGLNWVMGASLYGGVWNALSLQEKSNFINHYNEKQMR